MDYLRDPARDWIKPFKDSHMVVQRVWYPAAPGAPTLGFPTAFYSAHWEPFPWLPRNVGEIYPCPVTFRKTATPRGLTYDHVCGTPEQFATGLVFDPNITPVVYANDGIPTCCRPAMNCIFIRCTLDNQNGEQAAQLAHFPFDYTLAPDFIPYWERRVALALEPGVPPYTGYDNRFFPLGTTGDHSFREWDLTEQGGLPTLHAREWVRDANTYFREQMSEGLTTWNLAAFGATSQLTYSLVDGVGKVCGTNLEICREILPANLSLAGQQLVQADGFVQATAAPITASNCAWYPGSSDDNGLRLPAVDGARIWLVQTGAVGDAKLYPPLGESINGMAPNTPMLIGELALPGAVAVLAIRLDTTSPALYPITWTVIPVYDTPGGTVTSVGINPPSSGIGVSGSPIISAGSITLSLTDDLAALESLSGTNTIYYRSGASTWSPVTIGGGLSFSSGTLATTAPTLTSGETVGSSFSLVGASGTYVATGITVTLPAAGTYQLRAQVRGEVGSGAATTNFVTARFRNTTASADIANSETMIVFTNLAGQVANATAAMVAQVTVAGATTIELYAARWGSGWTTSQILSDTNGRTKIDWFRTA